MSQFIEMFGDTHMRSDHSRQWKEVVEIINGKDYKSIQVEDGGYPVYGTGGEMARASDYLSPANSILLGRKGTIDKPLLIREKYWNVDTAFGAVPDEKVLHYVYFYWHCKTIDFNVLNKGTTLPSTTKVDLLNLWIKIPSMEEQTRFGSIVEQADKSEFGDFKSQFIEMFKEKGYPLRMLKSFADVSTGGTPSKANLEYWNGDKPWVSAEDMKNKYVYDTCEKVTEAGYATCKIIPVDTLMYVCRGSIGVMAINKIECATNQSICRAKCHDNVCNVEFLYHALMYQKDNIKKMGTGTSFKSLNQTSFSELKIELPPYNEQMKFVSIAQQADKSKSVIQKALVYLNDIQSDELGKIA